MKKIDKRPDRLFYLYNHKVTDDCEMFDGKINIHLIHRLLVSYVNSKPEEERWVSLSDKILLLWWGTGRTCEKKPEYRFYKKSLDGSFMIGDDIYYCNGNKLEFLLSYLHDHPLEIYPVIKEIMI